jgi:hypothetical protein
MATTQKTPKMNPIVQALEARGAGKLVKLMAFVGDTKDGRVRLYPRLGGAVWVEVPVKDILHVEDADTPVEPSLVFLSTEAKMEAGASINADQAKALEAGGCQCGSNEITARAAVHLVDGSTGLALDPAFGIFFDPLWYWKHPELAVPRIPVPRLGPGSGWPGRPPWLPPIDSTECNLAAARCFGRCSHLTDEADAKRCYKMCSNALMDCVGLGDGPTPYGWTWR